MNERDLETRLRSTYRSRAGRADPGALTERVHSIPATVEPQRRRWWHAFGSDATRRAGLGGAQVRGANDMFTATHIAAVVAALALGTSFMAIQVGGPNDAAQPVAAPAGESWVTVTGNQAIHSDCGEGIDGMCGEMTFMSDPRLEGDLRITYESDMGAEEGPATFWSTITITNDEGSWEGSSVGFSDKHGAHSHTGWVEGRGAYEGLVFISTLTEANPTDPTGGLWLDVVGLVYEGELPPMVDPDWAADMALDAE